MPTLRQRWQAARAAWQQGGQGKAISHHPELADREHVYSSGGKAVAQISGDFESYARVYEVYAWVQKAVRKYADAIAPLPVRVVDGAGKAIEAHPVSELLAYVNPDTSPVDLWNAYCVQKLLGGETFHELRDSRAGVPVELWPRRPDLVDVVPDVAEPHFPRVAGYVYDEREVPFENVVHDKFYNPRQPFRGLAPAGAVRQGITIDMFAQAWSKGFLRGGARPDWALVAPEGLTTTERQDYYQRIDESHAGTENAHKPIVLEEGVTDIKTFSWSPVDIQWLEQRKFSRVEVAAVFGVPGEIMGWGEANTYENMDQAHLWFWKLTLLPFLMARDAAITAFFSRVRPLLARSERVATDTSSVAALQENIADKADAAKIFWSMGYPLNLIDDRMGLGFGPVPGGDVGFVPVGVMSIEQAQLRQAPTSWQPGQGEPANDGEDPGTGDDDAEPEDEELAIVGPRVAGLLPAVTRQVFPDYGSARHKAQWKAIQGIALPYEKAMRERLAADLAKQGEETGAALAAYMAREGTKQDQEPRIPEEASEFFDAEYWAAWFALRMEQFYTDMTRAAGAGVLAEIGVDVIFDLTDPFVANALKEMRMVFAEDITGTTLEMLDVALRAMLAEAQEEGWSAFQMATELGKRTDGVFGKRAELWQLERITRTEMGKARSLGRWQGAMQSGVQLVKTWSAAMDERTRDNHRNAHDNYQNTPIPADQPFSVGDTTMQAPRMSGVPAEDINCRCEAIFAPAILFAASWQRRILEKATVGA